MLSITSREVVDFQKYNFYKQGVVN